MQKLHFLCFSFILCLSIISCNSSTSQYSLNLDYYENMSVEYLCEIYPVNYLDLDEYRNASYAEKQDLKFEWGMKMGNYLIYHDYFNGKDGSSFKYDRSSRENASFAKMIFGIPTHIIYHEVYEPNITYKDFEELYLESYNMILTKFKNALNFKQLMNPTNSTEADIYRAVTVDRDDESENSVEQITPKEKELPEGLHIDIIRNEYNNYRHLFLSNSIVEY